MEEKSVKQPVADLREKAQVANVLRGPFLRENEEIVD